jgi:hypothetical protein
MGLYPRGVDARFWAWGWAIWLAGLIAAVGVELPGISLPGLGTSYGPISYRATTMLLAFALNLGLAVWIGRVGLRRGAVVAGLLAPLAVLSYLH